MSFARPDTSRRREPQSPGRRFGASNRPTARTTCLTPLLALATTAAITLAAATPIGADESEGPIMLSNDDVARLHAQEKKAAPARPAARTAEAAEGENAIDAAAHRAMEASLRKKLDLVSRQSMGSVSRTLDERILREGATTVPDLQTMPPVSAPAAPAPIPAPVPTNDEADAADEPTASLKRVDPEPACMYDTRGHLLHEPVGRECAPIRVSGPARSFESKETARSRTARESSVGCVYGSRGQLLYSSPGVECAG